MAIQNKAFTLFNDNGVEERRRSLRFDMNAMGDFEQMTGMGLAQLMSTRAVYAATRALLWAGLKHQDRGLTVDRVGQLMQAYVESGGRVDDLLEACILAAVEQKAIPDVAKTEDDGDADPNASLKPSPTTGTPSVPGPATSDIPSVTRSVS